MKSKTLFKKATIILGTILITVSSAIPTFAHSGRTDSSGGHRDNQNKSGLGSYHYHCGGYPAHLHDGGYCPYTDVMPSSVKIKVAKTTLDVGEELSIDAIVSPSNACDTDVTWDSSNPSVISVYGGEIVAKNPGTATITAETINGKKNSVKITVKEKPVKSVQIDDTEIEMLLGDTHTLNAIVTPDDATFPEVTWSVKNPDIVSVSDNGTITALACGETVVTATSKNNLTDSVVVKVNDIKTESITISGADTVVVGETLSLSVVFTPSNATNQTVSWHISNPEIASIDENGVLTAIKEGTVKVAAVTADGINTECEIEVSSESSGSAAAVGAVAVAGTAAAIGIIKKKKSR